ncbi:MAG TPA: response regulator, partial [Blastocatellia bacterium]|nr:response regulator [Blastocatellia bacterium]
TGLGLAVSHSIIERHGGRIEAQSEPGRGSTFLITLPVTRDISKKELLDSTAQVGSKRILVIDDDAGVRGALVGMLRSAGHDAEQASGGRAALEKMESELFDLVFTDLSMPEMDGWALAGELRGRWPRVKIVLTTGYALSPNIVRSNSHLIDGVVFKPVRFEDLSAVLGHVLSGGEPINLLTA